MDENLWHQVLRKENYEALESDEAEAVASEATAILSRTGSGRESLNDHHSQFAALGYDVSIRGWDAEPPVGRPEIGGLTIHQLQPIVHRAVQSGRKYLTSRPDTAGAPREELSDDTKATLDRVRDRLRRKKEDDKS